MLTYWAPTVNMDRDPRWGRTDEAFGEDPYLVSRMAGAFVDGYQGQTPTGRATSRYLKVAATAKHYALNDVEDTRHSGSSDTTDTNIRDYYTAQFAGLIADANVSGLMTSYNAINGTPAPADTYTANLLAQRTYGFTGYTTSDCGAVGDIYLPSSHNWAPPGWTTTSTGGQTTWANATTGQRVSGPAGAQAYALRAGTQLNCTGGEYTLENIQEAIEAGVLSEGVLDNALVHVFTVRMRTGEFDPPAQVPYTRITKDVIESPQHQQLATEVADNSLVLLKNDTVPGSGRKLLPADPATLHNVVIVGDLAGTTTLGGYSGEPTHRVTAVQGITDAVHAVDPDAGIVYDACGTSTTATTPAACAARTTDAIKSAGLVVVMAGTDQNVAREDKDRAGLALPGNYRSLIDQVTAIGNPRTALALQADGPVAIQDLRSAFPAIVFSGYNGQSQGTALADVLFGRQNPSGHLTFTWYADDSQLPAMTNYGLTPSQTGGLGRTYQYFTGVPTYPFGFGLSYTDFAYRGLRIDRRRATGDDTVRVSFTVTNTGRTAGATVAQLYVSTPGGTGSGQESPRERLAGFAKTRQLAPHESQRVTLAVPLRQLSVWNPGGRRQEVLRGRYDFAVGPDSATAALRGAVRVTADATPRLRTVSVQPTRVVFAPGDRLDLTGDNPWIADDTPQAGEHVRATRIVEATKSDQTFADLTHARLTYRSSNPKVARVSRDGLVTAVATGVATVSVTVDGVTGSVPVAVTEPFTMNSASIAEPGHASTVTAELPHPAGAPPLHDVTVALNAPDGWTVRPTSPTTFARVPGGQTVHVGWQVSAPADAGPGTYPLTAQVTFGDVNGRGSSQDSRSVALPYPSFTAAFNNVAVSDDGTTAGDIDGNGATYSAQALAAGTPSVTPGATVTHDGLSFTWPRSAPGTPDNVKAVGQVIPVAGSGSKLGLLGTGVYGTASGNATIVYTDGTTQSFTLSFADWWANSPAPGGDIVTTMPYLNIGGGRQNQTVSLYYTSVALRAGKTVRYLQLPNVNDGVLPGNVMHVFAVATG
ncbi:glycoside hydrolase family 3 C-terminal domain-containing protein [Actinoplanes subtropicus]|uniref:glycoside hydrolase family 3 C-terminal domain-containing protein n=1 Tax=Actinoplanes subtropicus TaxID=543632 RepID=UPI000B19168B|nr:glycoside hydrolase family 3 C-terminal domain-containing protein [Actinoplanes subtropicus]